MASNCRAAKDLPPDILVDILSRLPVKTLCKFRCVSKAWSGLISDPLFQQLHHQRSKQNPLLFIATVDVTRYGWSYERRRLVHSLFDKEERTLDILTSFQLGEGMYPSVSGLACCDLVCTYDVHNIYVCNPAVRKWITLPNTSSRYAQTLVDMCEEMLAYTCEERRRLTRHCWPLVALGYVASTSEYKVLRVYSYDEICGYSERCSFSCEVFTLGFKRWRDVKSPPDDVVIKLDGGMALVDGAVYFLSHYLHQEDSYIIAAFDLNKEDWSVLPIPYHDILPYRVDQGLSTCWISLSLLETRGLLCLAYFTHDWKENKKKLELWMQKDHGSLMWVKEYSIDTSSFLCYCPLAIEQDGRVLLHTSEYKRDEGAFCDTLEQRLQYYDPKDGGFEEIYAGKCNFTEVTVYAESLWSLRIKSFKPYKEPRKKHRRQEQRQANSNAHSVTIKNQFLALAFDEDEE